MVERPVEVIDVEGGRNVLLCREKKSGFQLLEQTPFPQPQVGHGSFDRDGRHRLVVFYVRFRHVARNRRAELQRRANGDTRGHHALHLDDVEGEGRQVSEIPLQLTSRLRGRLDTYVLDRVDRRIELGGYPHIRCSLITIPPVVQQERHRVAGDGDHPLDQVAVGLRSAD